MAFNLPNFLGVPTQGYGPEGLLESLMQGYQAGRMPAQMQNQEAQQREMLEQLMLGNQGKRTELEFQRPELEGKQDQLRAMIEQLTLGNEASRTKNRYLEPGLEQKLAAGAQNMRQKEAETIYRELLNKFLPEQQQAEIAQKTAQARNAGMTPDERELARLYGVNSPEFIEAINRKHGIYKNEQGELERVPEGAVSLAGAPANDRNRIYKEQKEQLNRIQGLKTAYSSLEKAKDIIDKHPNLASTMAAVLANPGGKTYKDKIARLGVNKEDLANVEKLDKIFSNVVLQMTNAVGGRAATNMRTQLTERAKGSALNTDEANKAIIDGMMREIYPEIAYEKDLKKVYRKYDLPFDRSAYPETPDEKESGGLVEGFINGQRQMVHPDNIDDFLEAGGSIR